MCRASDFTDQWHIRSRSRTCSWLLAHMDRHRAGHVYYMYNCNHYNPYDNSLSLYCSRELQCILSAKLEGTSILVFAFLGIHLFVTYRYPSMTTGTPL